MMSDKTIFAFMSIFVAIGLGAWWADRGATEQTATDLPVTTSVRNLGLEVVGETQVDLGKFKAGEPIGDHFELRNVSESEVMILAANPSCGCMKIPSTLLGKPIPPGDVIELPVIMKTEGRSGDVSGMVRIVSGSKPTIGTKITKTFEITVQLKCQIQNPIKISPDPINFGNIASSENSIIPFSLERTDRGRINDVNVAVMGGYFRLDDYKIVHENGKEFGRGKILPLPSVFHKGGRYGGSLELSCDDIGVKESTQTVDISAVSEPGLTTIPRNLVLFASRKTTAELKLVGNAADSIEEIICSSELADVLTCVQESSLLRVTYDKEGGKTDSIKSHIPGEIKIIYGKTLFGSEIREQCSVRVIIIP